MSELKRLQKMCESYVVFDCDIGTDDAWGLLMLIKGETLKYNNVKQTQETNFGPRGYKIIGVTCVQGNTDVENATINALRVLDSADRSDIPVFKGCAQPILPRTWERPKYFHGRDGFGDLKDEKYISLDEARAEHAVNAMYDFACRYPGKVDYILVGPLTNFAMCINMYGDDFLNKVNNIYIMGGNYRGKGNITKSAEFNFMMDPEAAHIVLENVKKPIVILPWETCIDCDFGITLDWRFEVLGSVSNKAIQLLNRAEEAILKPKGFTNWIVCDAMLVAAYIFPQQTITRSRLYHATVELTGTHTRGQMVLDHLRLKDNNVTVVMEMDRQHFKNVIAWTAGAEQLNFEN